MQIRQALPATLPLAASLLLASCGGGGGMGMSPTSMATNAMGSGSMGNMGSNMSCMGMDMSMNGNMSCPAPTVALVAPAATVSRTVTLRAQVVVMQGDAVARVDFTVDGGRVGTVSGSGPFGVSWDSTTVSDGAHTLTATASDSLGQAATSSPVTIEVNNHPAFTVALSPAQIIPAPVAASTGTAHLSSNLASGALSGSLVLSGVTASAVTLNEAFAGNRGAVLLTLLPGAGTGEWHLPAGAPLTAEQITALLQGGLYLTASSAANPGGELRGQITPANVTVIFSAMSGTQEVPPVAINASGVAATTADTVAHTLTLHVHASGIDDAMAGEVADGALGATGSRLTTLARDDIDPGHWSTELAAVDDAAMAAFKAGDWYVNVMTPEDPEGALRGQIALGGH
jgi:hypothetical protein